MSEYDDDMPLPDTDQPHLDVRLSPEAVERLLNLSITTARAGNKAKAHSLLRALTRHQPDSLRAWLWLAGVAETFAEQQQALEHVLTLDPEHPLARQGLERLRSQGVTTRPAPTPAPEAATTRPAPMAPVPPAPAPETDVYETDTYEIEETTLQRNRWIYLTIAALVILALVLSLGQLGLHRVDEAEEGAVPTATLPAQFLNLPSGAPTGMVAQNIVIAATPTSTTTLTEMALPVTFSTTEEINLALTPGPSPLLTPQATEMGNVLQRDGWQATLLRPDYAQFIDGAVGDILPRGQFVLTLLAIGNSADTPRQIPIDLFVLVDGQGRSYAPDLAASTAYRVVNPSGQWDDRTSADTIPPGGRRYTMPLLFDVPHDATSLLLTMGQQVNEGWQIRDSTQPGAAPAS